MPLLADRSEEVAVVSADLTTEVDFQPLGQITEVDKVLSLSLPA